MGKPTRFYSCNTSFYLFIISMPRPLGWMSKSLLRILADSLSSNTLCTELCRTKYKRRVLRLVIFLFLGIVCHWSVWTCTRVDSRIKAEREKKSDIVSRFVWLKVDNIYSETSHRANKVRGRLDEQIFFPSFQSLLRKEIFLFYLFVSFSNRWQPLPQTTQRNANPKGGKMGRIIKKEMRTKERCCSCKQMQEGVQTLEKFPAGWEEADETRYVRTRESHYRNTKTERKEERKTEIILWTTAVVGLNQRSADKCGLLRPIRGLFDPISTPTTGPTSNCLLQLV